MMPLTEHLSSGFYRLFWFIHFINFIHLSIHSLYLLSLVYGYGVIKVYSQSLPVHNRTTTFLTPHTNLKSKIRNRNFGVWGSCDP